MRQIKKDNYIDFVFVYLKKYILHFCRLQCHSSLTYLKPINSTAVGYKVITVSFHHNLVTNVSTFHRNKTKGKTILRDIVR